MKHTAELQGVLTQMQHVLEHADGVRAHRFDSGPGMERPWIGFNVNDMDYFFFLSLNTPERLTLQRWGRGVGVDPGSFDESLGELDVRSDGVARWRHSIDLADPTVGYFKADRARQLEIIRNFFEESFRYAQAIEAPAIAAGG